MKQDATEIASRTPGTLYIVGTPIGNLDDISARAINTLSAVDVIAAEDTRQSRKLLDRYGIKTPLVAYHQHNESSTTTKLIDRLQTGQRIALVCDAGTPLISDPGVHLVKAAHQNSIQVIPIPGASALSCALSVCGLDICPFHFEGFLPARRTARTKRLQQLAKLQSALVFFEAPHRILQSLEDMVEVLGAERQACFAREMTKLHEQVQFHELAQLAQTLRINAEQLKGEFVVIVASESQPIRDIDTQVEHTLEILIAELSARKAVEITAKIFGIRRNRLYQRSLELQAKFDENSPKH